MSNFSSEEAAIREVWLEEKICLSRRGKMSGGGERTNGVVLSSCSILDLLSGLKEINGCAFVVVYIMLTSNYSGVFSFNRNVLVGSQLSM